ncbi:50S ribosomal protein L23 [Candidatus Woesearchaeota archaeon]|nr:50S ribosomal protein L23 [Candidatus Woesearchaeota archaeon]
MSAVIKYPLATEKSIRLMEAQNTLIFVVAEKATKPQIKKAVEERFDAKVEDVRTLHGPDNKKRAYITFNEATPAIDIATKLGLM